MKGKGGREGDIWGLLFYSGIVFKLLLKATFLHEEKQSRNVFIYQEINPERLFLMYSKVISPYLS